MLESFEVRKGDMLKALNTTDIFVHSCNGQGVWGSGIAAAIRGRCPKAYEQYKAGPNKVGNGYIVADGDYKIGCLITSKGYGKYVDSSKNIASNTLLAISSLLDDLEEKGITEVTIHSPKINSGLFRTPWQWTKKAIKNACNIHNPSIKVKWIVWEL